jgi:tRNA A37 threonylcarbamoyladenosine synthetase subunit TsaC/SUA5/YrdC
MAPEDENEAALVTYLYPGAYTVVLEGKDESGTGLVEVYLAPYSLPLE